ncbi:MAG: hypothetical protein AAGH78_01245 [Cyanobacteria bacterium P01_H01_bin.58]
MNRYILLIALYLVSFLAFNTVIFWGAQWLQLPWSQLFRDHAWLWALVPTVVWWQGGGDRA